VAHDRQTVRIRDECVCDDARDLDRAALAVAEEHDPKVPGLRVY